ncbi:endo alpha-1,4 polygalactosaminidase [Georgenia faecalis]|uniref:Endo alpha-1,4 polygalactosaminidase n=1 Tax=Georgenia faecalis TaxID=2483799 RepID=A0ABV9D998_9MICO|nr:endo alpha-1,4 polygalactosaminidase [Georgenia faecalis]
MTRPGRARRAAAVLALGVTLAGCSGAAPPPDSSATPSAPPSSTAEGTWWHPDADDVTTWQYQLTGPLAVVDADVYDLEPDAVTPAQVAALQAGGARVLCYVSVGSVEEWREDAGDLPDAVVGEPLEGWPDERWLDVRERDVLLDWVAPRLQRCAEAGFDGVELDNVDAYANDTGFPLTVADSEAYVRALVDAAHAEGLAVALKNAPELVEPLAAEVDLAVVEECVAEGSCGDYRALREAGLPVLAVEYGPVEGHCGAAQSAGLVLIGKDLDLGPERESCPAPRGDARPTP